MSGLVISALSAVSPERLRDVCGDDAGFICREVLNRSDDRALAELADTFLGTSLTILAIVVVALIAVLLGELWA